MSRFLLPRRSLIVGAAALAAERAIGQAVRQPGVAPGFKPGFQFLGNALWTPLNDIGGAGNLLAWWDPSYGITLASGKVSSWADRVSGLAASQGTASAQPGVSTRNGAPRLTFAGAQNLAFTGTGLPQGTSPGWYACSSYANVKSGMAFTLSGAQNAGRLLLTESNGVAGIGCYGADVQSTTAWFGADVFVDAAVASGGATTIHTNGTQTGSGTFSLSVSSDYRGGIGYWAAFSNFWNGDIGHCLIRGSVPSAALRAKYQGWESWADGKGGANLPAGHPYASRPPYVSDP